MSCPNCEESNSPVKFLLSHEEYLVRYKTVQLIDCEGLKEYLPELKEAFQNEEKDTILYGYLKRLIEIWSE